MMTQDEVLQAFKETDALLEGHFELRSKLHSNRYFQCANVLRYPRVAARLCDAVVDKARAACDLGRLDGVISPAVGGILVGHEVARALDTKCVFAEKVPGEGVDASGKPNTVLAMRRFKLTPGERYVVAEDVVTKGGRVQETIDLVKAAGCEVAAVVLLVDRSGGTVTFGDIPMFSLMQMTPETWTAADCPMCRAGDRPVHPGS
jgi:orotate phosphoribosyltransferase